jgi:hypothetical protein
MVAESPAIAADTVEREIIARLGAAKLRLRFDKVALRLVGGLKAALASVVPEGETVAFTITAPIRLPAKTAGRWITCCATVRRRESAVRSSMATRFAPGG